MKNQQENRWAEKHYPFADVKKISKAFSDKNLIYEHIIYIIYNCPDRYFLTLKHIS